LIADSGELQKCNDPLFHVQRAQAMADPHSTSGGTIHCVVVTPEATVLDAPADFVALPLFDGECGILPGRSPLIGRLGFGELRIRRGGELFRYYVDGGFAQVADNVVSVLTNRAVPANLVDATAASSQLSAALARPAAGKEELAIRDRLILQARGQLRVAQRTG
jgi:F-type H+-transporting ATPase subunit epsilon